MTFVPQRNGSSSLVALTEDSAGCSNAPAFFLNTAPASFRKPTATAALKAGHRKEQTACGDSGHNCTAVNGQQRGKTHVPIIPHKRTGKQTH